ncbi:MAG: bile acid:sodium symporter [Desulfobulbales bacterium]|jgi:BASS family bile acid:Na+ symporter
MSDILDLFFKISLAIFMAGSLLEMGLRINLQDAFRGLRNFRFVAHTLVWSFIICPALAFAITRVIPLEPPYAIGLILLGMAPCAPFVPLLVDKAKGDLGFTAAFMVLASVGTVICMPFTVPLLAKGLTTSAWAIAKPLLIVVLLPMAAGVILRRKSDPLATKMLPIVKKGAGLAGLIWCVLCLIIYGKSLLGVVGELAVASELLFFALIFAGTYWLGFGLRHEQKIVLSVGVTTRNLGACLAPLLSVPDMDQRATLMIVLALPIMVIVSVLGTKWSGRFASPASNGH